MGDFVVSSLILLIILYSISFIKRKWKENRIIKAAQKKKETLVTNITSKVEESGLDIIEWNIIKYELDNYDLKYIQNLEIRIDRIIKLSLKYQNIVTQAELDNLISRIYYIGMSEEKVIDSVGEPDKIEDEVQKTKTKRTYIYGNKSSGDVLVFENGVLVRFKDR